MNFGRTVYKPKQFFIHEKHLNPPYANDIALILIDGEMKFNKKVEKIELARTAPEDGMMLKLSKLRF